MTRAYMSEQTLCGRPSDLAAEAIREARRILADTEPETVGAYATPDKPHLSESVLTRDYDAYRVAVDCLADALAAFVTDGV